MNSKLIGVALTSTLFLSAAPVEAAVFNFSGKIVDFAYLKFGNGSNPPSEFEIGAPIELEYKLSNVAEIEGEFDFGIESYILRTNDDILSASRTTDEVLNGGGNFKGSGNLTGEFALNFASYDSGFTVTDPLGIEGEMPVDLIVSRDVKFHPDILSIGGLVTGLDDMETCNSDPGTVTRCFEGSWFKATVEISDLDQRPPIPEPTSIFSLVALVSVGTATLKRKAA